MPPLELSSVTKGFCCSLSNLVKCHSPWTLIPTPLVAQVRLAQAHVAPPASAVGVGGQRGWCQVAGEGGRGMHMSHTSAIVHSLKDM